MTVNVYESTAWSRFMAKTFGKTVHPYVKRYKGNYFVQPFPKSLNGLSDTAQQQIAEILAKDVVQTCRRDSILEAERQADKRLNSFLTWG